MEYRAACDAELLFAGGFEALVEVFADVLRLRFALDSGDTVTATSGTADAIGPALPFEESEAFLFGA